MPSPKKGMSAFMFYIDDWRASWSVEAMDDHEKVGYLNLLMRAASSPDCGLPDNDLELAVISGLGTKWFKPTRDRNKRIGKQNPDGTFSFKSAGDKLRECFSFRPKTAQLPEGRLYNERLYQEYVRKQEVSSARSDARKQRHGRNDGENDLNNCSFETPSEPPCDSTNGQQTAPHLPPPTSVCIEENHLPPTKPEVGGQVVALDTNLPKPETPRQPENTTDGYQEFTEHCKSKGLASGSRQLWASLRRKFPQQTAAQILENLPVFDGQTSPGLWGHHNPKALADEADRQRAKGRFPAQSEDITERFLRMNKA
jgi:hypothetical protein